MVLKSYLLEDEEILAQAENLYASNRRLLRYEKRFWDEEFEDIPYSHITSIGVVKNTRRGMVKAGATFAVIGLFMLLTMAGVKHALASVSGLLSSTTVSVPKSLPIIGFNPAAMLSPLLPLSVVLLVAGTFMLVFAVLRPHCYIQFRAPGLTSDAENRFRLGDIRNEASLNLARIVRQQSLSGESNRQVTFNGSRNNLTNDHQVPSKDKIGELVK